MPMLVWWARWMFGKGCTAADFHVDLVDDMGVCPGEKGGNNHPAVRVFQQPACAYYVCVNVFHFFCHHCQEICHGV